MCAASLLGLLLPLGLTFNLEPSTERCITEHIPAKSLIAGDWEISELKDSSSSVEVRVPSGQAVFVNKERMGHFAVTAQATGVHRVCFQSNASEMRTVSLNLKTALEVDDHQTVAKKEHVEAIEAELDRMKQMAVHVYEEMLYMRSRSDSQHATNASMRGRLLWVEVVMMFAVLLMGLWQIHYLRNYFRVKKLI